VPAASAPANRGETGAPKPNRGRFKKGQSGNPNGRPKDVYGIAAKARELSTECLEELAKITRSADTPPQARIAAINSILDRGLGKPMQPTQQQQLGPDGEPIAPAFIVNVSQYIEPQTAPETMDGEADTRH
jgi:hypothetical protein